MTPTRVLYLCGGRSFRVQNPGRKVGCVAKCWRRLGHEVAHVCGGDVEPGGGAAVAYGAPEVHRRWYRKLSVAAPLVHSYSEWRDIRHDRGVLDRVRYLSREWKPDVIWERSCRLHMAGLVLSREIGVPYVLEWKDHLIPYDLSLFHRRAIRTEARKEAEADFIVVESGVLRDQLAAQGIAKAPIIVAHNGVDPDEFRKSEQDREAVRQSLRLGPKAVLVGYLGSYASYHDAIRLVLAAGILQSRGINGLRFLMVGDGKDQGIVRRAAEDRGLLGSLLVMRPPVPERQVPSILSALDVAVLPGTTDIICPIKIPEYMAAELPVVLPDYACNREVITDGESGLLCAPKDANSLACKLELLARNPALRITLGREARRQVLRRFTWEQTWGAALSSVLSKSAACA